MDARAGKQALRGQIREARAQRSADADAAASAALAIAVRGDAAWRDARAVAAFVGIAGEPNTMPLLRDAIDAGKTLWLPRVLDGRGGISELVAVDTLDGLAPAGFGLLEPRRTDRDRIAPAITPDLDLDLVLVPGLAFASDGARLGHGAGHYDRLLAAVASLARPRRYGLCFAEFLDRPRTDIPMCEHDVRMHAVVTEGGITPCT